MVEIAQRMARIKPSATMAITSLAAELRAAGKDVIGLGAGEPDFDTPEPVREAAKLAIDRGQTRYTAVDGTPALKQAVADKFRRDNGLDYALDQISVASGGKQILYNAFMATLNPGDEVIIPAPYWVSYPDMVQLAEGQPVILECSEAAGFKLTPAQLSAAINERTRWLVLNSPSNPTGVTYSAEELGALAEVLLEHPDLMILTDDIYEHLIYDGSFSTIAQVEPRLAARTLTCNGASKAYAMTGWRIGFAAGPAALIKAMAKIQSQSTSNPSSVSQAAAEAALNGDQSFLDARNKTFRERRDIITAMLNAAEGLSCQTPAGAFYVYPSCAGVIGKRSPDGTEIKSDSDFARYLLDLVQVAVVPGVAFGLSPYFRVSYATSTEALKAAGARIQEACARLT
jgi:aspartate aminotransferase